MREDLSNPTEEPPSELTSADVSFLAFTAAFAGILCAFAPFENPFVMLLALIVLSGIGILIYLPLVVAVNLLGVIVSRKICERMQIERVSVRCVLALCISFVTTISFMLFIRFTN